MEQELIDYIAARAEILSTSPAAKQATQEAAAAWLESVKNGANAEEETTKLADFLEGRPNSIDGVIAFAQGPAVQMMGAEAAQQFLNKQLERKEQGAKYCDCPACTAATEILAKLGRIEL